MIEMNEIRQMSDKDLSERLSCKAPQSERRTKNVFFIISSVWGRYRVCAFVYRFRYELSR